MSGNPATVASAIQPQIASLTSQYNNIQTTEAETAPRGGGRTAALTEAPYQEAGQVATLVGQAQQGAAQELASLGIGELSAATGAAQTGLAGAASQADQANNAAQQQAQAGASIGGLIALLVGA